MKNTIIIVFIFSIAVYTYGQKKAAPGDLNSWKTTKWEAKELSTTELKAKPIKVNEAIGKAQYIRDCRACHGELGQGNGSRAKTLKTFPGDFSTIEFQKQTDEAIFWKTKYGGGDMPKYTGKIYDETIWNLVAYMRNFKK